jgi:hypothetical protein
MEHKHSHHKMVKKTLLKIAKEQNEDFATIKKMFVYDCDPAVTVRFWNILRADYPNHQYVDVYHCPGCGKFDLE